MKTKKYLLSALFAGIMILFSGMFYVYGYGGVSNDPCSNGDCGDCPNGWDNPPICGPDDDNHQHPFRPGVTTPTVPTTPTNSCTNGYTNYPVCGDVCGDGVCSTLEGLTSLCPIDCRKDCLIPGTCGPNKCTNSYTNYPICGPEITKCQPTQSGAAPSCSYSGLFKTLSQSTQKIGNVTKTTFFGSCTNATSTDIDTNGCSYTVEKIDTDTCPAIPTPPADWCKNGTIIPGGKDSQGCQLPSTCKEGNTCSVLTPITTQTTTQTNTNTTGTRLVCPAGYNLENGSCRRIKQVCPSGYTLKGEGSSSPQCYPNNPTYTGLPKSFINSCTTKNYLDSCKPEICPYGYENIEIKNKCFEGSANPSIWPPNNTKDTQDRIFGAQRRSTLQTLAGPVGVLENIFLKPSELPQDQKYAFTGFSICKGVQKYQVRCVPLSWAFTTPVGIEGIIAPQEVKETIAPQEVKETIAPQVLQNGRMTMSELLTRYGYHIVVGNSTTACPTGYDYTSNGRCGKPYIEGDTSCSVDYTASSTENPLCVIETTDVQLLLQQENARLSNTTTTTTQTNTGCIGGTIVSGSNNTSLCQKTTSCVDLCPVITTLTNWCDNGTIVPGGKDAQGCQLPDTCTVNKCTTLPSLESNFCFGGTIVLGGLDVNGCPKSPTCRPSECPLVPTPPADWCTNGTIIPGGKDANDCKLPDSCQNGPICTVYEEQKPADWCTNGTIVPGPLNAQGCRMPSTCFPTVCPAIAQPNPNWCAGGTVIPGGKDAQGCQKPDTCKKDGCPTLEPLPANFCYGGTITPGGLDAQACPTLPTCQIDKKYYIIAGTVTNDLGGVLPNIIVNLKDSAGKITSATTNDAGRYTFSGNVPGTYTLRPENTQPYIFPYSEKVEVTTSNVSVDFSAINIENIGDDNTAELLKRSAESDELIFKGGVDENSGISDWIKSILKGSPNGKNENDAGQTATLSEGTTGNSFSNIFATNSLFKLLNEGYLPLTNTYSPIPLSLLEKFGDTSTICGNGTVESGETCDDGVNNGTEGRCSSDCLYIGEVRFTGEELNSGLESNALSEGLDVSLEVYQEVGDMVSGAVNTGINFMEDATGVIGEVFQNAAESLKQALIENTSPEVRAIIAQTGEVAQTVGKYTVIGATSLLGVTAICLNVLVFKSMWTTYTVMEGDTLSSIGSQFTMTERAMRAKNGLGKGKRLRPGMKIRVRNRHFIEKDYLDQLKTVLKDELTKRNHGKMADKIDKLFAKK